MKMILAILNIALIVGCGSSNYKLATDKGIASFQVAYESAIESARISLTTLGSDFKITTYEDEKGLLICEMPVSMGLVKLFGKEGAKKLVLCKCMAEKRFETPTSNKIKKAWADWSFLLKDKIQSFDNDLLAYYFACAEEVGLNPKNWISFSLKSIPESLVTLEEKKIEEEMLAKNLSNFGENLDMIIAELVRDGVAADIIAAFKQTKEDMIKQLKVYSKPIDGPTRTKTPFRILIQEHIAPIYSNTFGVMP